MNEMKITLAWVICSAKNQTVFSLAPLALIFCQDRPLVTLVQTSCSNKNKSKNRLPRHSTFAVLLSIERNMLAENLSVNQNCFGPKLVVYWTKSCPFLFCKVSTVMHCDHHTANYVKNTSILSNTIQMLNTFGFKTVF